MLQSPQSSITQTLPPSYATWTILVISIIIYLLKATGLDRVLRSAILGPHDPFSPTSSPHGTAITGPPFVWPAGNLADKFLHGRKKGLEWRKAYGPVYRVWSGDKPEVVLTRPDDVATFYRDAQLHIKPSDSDGGWLFKEILGFGLGLVSEGQWRRLRGHFDPHFNHAAISSFVPDILAEAPAFVDKLNPTNAQSVELHASESFKTYAFLLVAKLIYGELSSQQKAHLESLIDLHSAIFKHILGDIFAMIPFAQYLPFLSATKASVRFHDGWLAFNREAAEIAKSDTRLPITQFWKAFENGEMSEKELLNTVDESLFANVDVSANAVSWSILFLSAHPSSQTALRAEIAANAHDIDGYVRRSDTLLHYTFMETIRLRPIASHIPPESATVDKVLQDGYIIPAGTHVVTDAVAISVRDQFWYSHAASLGDPVKFDPTKFCPERFAHLTGPQIRKHVFTFGFGPRQCLGKYVADRMVKALLCFLYARYQTVVLPGGVDAEGEWKYHVETFVQLPDVKLRMDKLDKPLL